MKARALEVQAVGNRRIPAELTITQMAELLGISRSTVALRCRTGVYPTVRYNGGHRVILLSWVMSQPGMWDSIVARYGIMDGEPIEPEQEDRGQYRR